MAFGFDDAAMILGPLLGGIFGGGGGDSSPTSTAEQRALQQQMLKMIQQQQGYMGQMDPLRESMLRMAMGMLPTRYQTPTDGALTLPDFKGGRRPSGLTADGAGEGQPWGGPSGRPGPNADGVFERRQF